MQALRDAGIVLVVILLLVSVRLTPLDEAETASDASLTPRTEAAAVNVEIPETRWVEQAVPAGAPVVEAGEGVMILRQELSRTMQVLDPADREDIEYCTQVMFRLQAAEEATHEHEHEAEEIVRVLSCSA